MHPSTERFEEIVKEIVELHRLKSADYGREFDPCALKIPKLKVGARHVEPGAGKIRIDRQDPLECDGSFVGFAAVECRDAKQVIETLVAGQFIFMRFKQSVGFSRLARFHVRVRIGEQALRVETRRLPAGPAYGDLRKRRHGAHQQADDASPAADHPLRNVPS